MQGNSVPILQSSEVIFLRDTLVKHVYNSKTTGKPQSKAI